MTKSETRCTRCKVRIAELENLKVIKPFQTICNFCVKKMDNYSEGYAEGSRTAKLQIRDFLKSMD